ncbi:MULTISPECIES: hypothetical protein [Amycolatopsis]|uniref:Uncharacterized protein n=1 Tax=Amycolatopsis albidoflavus TaxID=102226 RepID=A0ABW5HXE2_9PSEU
MTIYSQHAQRGKIQILANYRGWGGMVASTVTSVDSSKVARPIVDALNRISACATVPVSVHDERNRRVNYYPARHLAALTDRAVRASLLEGTHSLWYEQVMWLLHGALIDLDEATAGVPAPVRMAVEAELETEERWLRAALAEFSEGSRFPMTKPNASGISRTRSWCSTSGPVSAAVTATLWTASRQELATRKFVRPSSMSGCCSTLRRRSATWRLVYGWRTLRSLRNQRTWTGFS